MGKYLNFYENLQEAQIRLRQTVVLYDKIPYVVMAICSHNKDGVFRVYLNPIDYPPDFRPGTGQPPYPTGVGNFNSADPGLGPWLDEWLAANPTTRVIRKSMDSSYFNKFRPFPLGMVNYQTGCYYLERAPMRHREQGLTNSMLVQTNIISSSSQKMPTTIDMYTPAFHACVVGNHPTAEECVKNLLDPLVENDAVAFDRHFAIVRGPLDMLFLAYKTDIVAVLPKNDFTILRLGRDFGHCKEVIEELRLFQTVI